MEQEYTLNNESELMGVLQALRLQSQDQAKYDRMSQPWRGSSKDSIARRRDAVSNKLIMGSLDTCDLSTSIKATNVIRIA